MFFFHNSRDSVLLLMLLLTVCGIIIPINSQSQLTYNSIDCEDPSNQTSNASFTSELTALLDSLSDKASQNISFYNDTSNGIYGLFLCRGDVSNDTCQSCVRYASQYIASHCSFNRSGIIWFDQCMLRYSNINFFGKEATLPGLLMWNVNSNNATSADGVDFGIYSLMYDVMNEASKSSMLFNANSKESDGSATGYGLAQCTRDINVSSCTNCFETLMKEADQCCKPKKGWRILGPSCNIRFETYPFFVDQQPPPTVPPVPSVPSQPLPGEGRTWSETRRCHPNWTHKLAPFCAILHQFINFNFMRITCAFFFFIKKKKIFWEIWVWITYPLHILEFLKYFLGQFVVQSRRNYYLNGSWL